MKRIVTRWVIAVRVLWVKVMDRFDWMWNDEKYIRHVFQIMREDLPEERKNVQSH